MQKYYYLPVYYAQQIVFKVEIAFANTFEDKYSVLMASELKYLQEIIDKTQ